MFPFNSNPFRLRLFQSQNLYNNLCKLYAIFVAWFKIHRFLEAKYIFSEKLILSSFRWDIALITSVNTVDKKIKEKKGYHHLSFFLAYYKELKMWGYLYILLFWSYAVVLTERTVWINFFCTWCARFAFA